MMSVPRVMPPEVFRTSKGQSELPSQRTIPVAPIVLTGMLLGLSGYWLWFGAQQTGARPGATGLSPPGEATLRVAVWDLDGSVEVDLAARFAGGAKSSAAAGNPDVIALQSVRTRAYAHNLAAKLGTDWQVEVVPQAEASERFLAVLVRPGLQIRRRNLLDTRGAGFALMVELQTPRGLSVQVISAWCDPSDVAAGRGYVDWIARRCQQHPGSTVILAGAVGAGLVPSGEGEDGAGASLPPRTPDGYAQVQPILASAGQPASFDPTGVQMLVQPATLGVQQAVLLDSAGSDSVSEAPLVVDFNLP